MIHKLIFDTTDANTIADSHHVGSHTLSGLGDLISSGDGSADNVANTFEGLDTRSFLFGFDSGGGNWDRVQQVAGALKVYIDDGDFAIDVALDGVYDGGGNLLPDNVGMISHVRNATPGVTHQTFRSTGGAASSDDVVAANVHGLDVNAFGMVFDGTTWDRLRGTAGAVNIHDGGNSITVDATDLDIRDLTHVSDSVRLGDGTDFYTSTTIGADVGLDVNLINDPALANSSLVADAVALAVVDTAEDIIASPLANRKYLWLYNNDNRTAYIGATPDAATGFPLPPGSYIHMRAGAAVAIQFVSNKLAHDMRYMELA